MSYRQMLGVRPSVSAVWTMFEPIMPPAPTMTSFSFVKYFIINIFFKSMILFLYDTAKLRKK